MGGGQNEISRAFLINQICYTEYIMTILTFLIYLLICIFIARMTIFIGRKYKLWKSVSRDDTMSNTSKEFQAIHNIDDEKRTPRIGGVMVWLSALIGIFLLTPLDDLVTMLVIAILVFCGVLGFLDDWLQTRPVNSKWSVDGIPRTYRLLAVVLFSVLVCYIFYTNTSTELFVPLFGFFQLPLWFLVIFGAFVMTSTYSSAMIDGIDGLAATILITIYTTLFVISGMTLFGIILVPLLVYLWFNAPPAQVYFGETGMMPLMILLAFLAIASNTILLLPIFGIILVLTVGSSLIQILYFKLFGKRIFKIAPMHFALIHRGWSRQTIVIRYLVITIFACAISAMIFLA